VNQLAGLPELRRVLERIEAILDWLQVVFSDIESEHEFSRNIEESLQNIRSAQSILVVLGNCSEQVDSLCFNAEAYMQVITTVDSCMDATAAILHSLLEKHDKAIQSAFEELIQEEGRCAAALH
jgi:hypothetical protein